MSTIEERAKDAIQKACDKCMFRKACTQHCNDYNRYIDVCKKALKEQDHIARQEERDRCKKEFCATCKWFACREGSECRHFKDFIKSIEGGNENERQIES